MDKRQLIDDIRKYNTSVRPQFLSQFDEAALQQYLDNLMAAHTKHVQIGTWVRRPQPKLRLVS
jgi:hypothetical protein